jgi:hypothetical protein
VNTTFTDEVIVPGLIAQPAMRRFLRAQAGRFSEILSICDANARTSVKQIKRFYALHLPLSRETARPSGILISKNFASQQPLPTWIHRSIKTLKAATRTAFNDLCCAIASDDP